MKEIVFTIIIIASMIAFTTCISYLMGNQRCYAIANALGYKCEFHYFTGCVLEKPNGKKVLLKQLREFAE